MLLQLILVKVAFGDDCDLLKTSLGLLSYEAKASGKPDRIYANMSSRIFANANECSTILTSIRGPSSATPATPEQMLSRLRTTSSVDPSDIVFDEASWSKIVASAAEAIEVGDTLRNQYMKSSDTFWVIDNMRATGNDEAKSTEFFSTVVKPCSLGDCGIAAASFLAANNAPIPTTDATSAIQALVGIARHPHPTFRTPERNIYNVAIHFVEEVSFWAQRARCTDQDVADVLGFDIAYTKYQMAKTGLKATEARQYHRYLVNSERESRATLAFLTAIENSMFMQKWPQRCDQGGFRAMTDRVLSAARAAASESANPNYILHMFMTNVFIAGSFQVCKIFAPFTGAIIDLKSVVDITARGEVSLRAVTNSTARGWKFLGEAVTRQVDGKSYFFGGFKSAMRLTSFLREFARVELFQAIRDYKFPGPLTDAVNADAGTNRLSGPQLVSIIVPGAPDVEDPMAAMKIMELASSPDRTRNAISRSIAIPKLRAAVHALIAAAVAAAQTQEVQRLWAAVAGRLPIEIDCAVVNLTLCKTAASRVLTAPAFAKIEKLIEQSGAADEDVFAALPVLPDPRLRLQMSRSSWHLTHVKSLSPPSSHLQG